MEFRLRNQTRTFITECLIFCRNVIDWSSTVSNSCCFTLLGPHRHSLINNIGREQFKMQGLMPPQAREAWINPKGFMSNSYMEWWLFVDTNQEYRFPAHHDLYAIWSRGVAVMETISPRSVSYVIWIVRQTWRLGHVEMQSIEVGSMWC